MTIHVDLSPEMEGFIESKVASGSYGSAGEVVLDAIRRMHAEEARVAAWQAAIEEGDAQLDRGEGIECTPEVLEDIARSAIDDMHSAKAIDADVLP